MTQPEHYMEQARQLVKQWASTSKLYIEERDVASMADLIASFAAEATTQEQAVGIERAAEIADERARVLSKERSDAPPMNRDKRRQLMRASNTATALAIAIRALSPDLSYHNRVTELERELAELKEINQGIIDGIADGKALIESQHQVELAHARNKAATSALEQAAQVAENAQGWAYAGQGKTIAAAIRALKSDAAIGDDKDECAN